MKIENKIEAGELVLALVARLNVIQARLREGKPHLRLEQLKQSLALRILLDRAKQARQEILDGQPKYRYLAVGEIIQDGDEILRHSPYDGSAWAPCYATVGSPVRLSKVGDFRRAV